MQKNSAPDFGFDYVGGGWELTADGQIKRARTMRPRVARLLRPLFGSVVGEMYRGNPPSPKRWTPPLGVVLADRVRLLLEPMLTTGAISDLEVTVSPHDKNPAFAVVVVRGVDNRKQQFSHNDFVRLF